MNITRLRFPPFVSAGEHETRQPGLRVSTYLGIMAHVHLRTFAEQVADYLKEAILRGGFRDLLPGKMALAAQLGVNHKTITEAVSLLEREGLVVAQGPGRRRRIAEIKVTPTGLRMGLFLYEPADRQAHDVLDLRERLMAAGHPVRIPSRSLTELGMNPQRIARVVGRSKTDVWVVLSASLDVLQWFAAQPIPTTALYIDEASVFIAARDYLARRGIHAPEHVSLVCADPSPCFEWCKPTVAHLRWNSDPVVSRIVQWVANIARGKEDRRRIYTKSDFVEGGTVGPVPDGR